MVWDVMLSPETYQQWTETFMPGSRYEGSWDEGSDIRFLAADPESGIEGGMYARIAENREHEFVSIAHLGEVHGDKTTPYPADSPGFENYTFEDISDGTRLAIDITGLPDEYRDMMDEMWPKALDRLKELAEAWKTDINVADQNPQ